MRLCVLLIVSAFMAAGILSGGASDLSARSWEECIKAPDRDCILNEAMNQVYMLDRTDRRAALVASVAETLAKAGEIDQAVQLETQIPDRLLTRAAVEREIAAAQARAAHRQEAEAGFDRALQLVYRWKDPLQRAEALYAIAEAQADAGMRSAADLTYDQALQAAAAIRIVGQQGQVVLLPAPETRLAQLLQKLAMHHAKQGEMDRALEIARSIRDDHATRSRTLLAIADLQWRAGATPEAVLDDALEAEQQARFGMLEWPSVRDSGLVVKDGSRAGNIGLLCDIAKAQSRAGLAAKASASFDEALRAAHSSILSIADVAAAQHEAGLNAAARATLARAVAGEAAMTDQALRAAALARVTEVQVKLADAAPAEAFLPALAMARALPKPHQRALALQQIAVAEADAGLGEDARPIFAEAAAVASQDQEILSSIADAQLRAGLLRDAAVTFQEALMANLSGEGRSKTFLLRSLIYRIADNGRGTMISTEPQLGTHLLEAAGAIPEGLDRAEILTVIARARRN